MDGQVGVENHRIDTNLEIREVMRTTMHLEVHGQTTLHDDNIARMSHMISIGDGDLDLREFRLPSVAVEHHLCLQFRDRKSADRPGAPREVEIRPLFNWLDTVGDIEGLLVHCGAGMSRSPAIAVLTLCYLNPSADPFQLMLDVEKCSKCDYIWPNPLVVSIGDQILQRNGEIVNGVDAWRRMKEPETFA